jgi:hypothetical protein
MDGGLCGRGIAVSESSSCASELFLRDCRPAFYQETKKR